MKRIIRVVMLLMAMLLVGNVAYSQNQIIRTPGSTAKKKSTGGSRSSNSKKSLSVTDFLKKDTYGFSGFKNDSQIESALRNAGFTLTLKKVTKEELEVGSDGEEYAPGKTTEFVYSKNGTRVEWTSYCYDDSPKDDYKYGIGITFKDSSSKKAFISNLKANGFHREYDFSYGMIYYTVEGNKVTLMGNWE